MANNSTVRYQPIVKVGDRQLQWVQPHALKRHYELLAGERVVASIDFERLTLATATSGDGSWTFKREGFWHPQITVRTAGAQNSIAVFRPHFSGGGELRIPGGPAYDLKVASFWHSEWEWRQQDQVLVQFKRPAGLFKSSALLEIAPAGRRLPELDLLVLLGWYLMVLYAQDMAVQSAGIAAAAR